VKDILYFLASTDKTQHYFLVTDSRILQAAQSSAYIMRYSFWGVLYEFITEMGLGKRQTWNTGRRTVCPGFFRITPETTSLANISKMKGWTDMTSDSGFSNSQRRSSLARCSYSGQTSGNSAQNLKMHAETLAWAGPFLGVAIQDNTNASNAKGRQSLLAWG